MDTPIARPVVKDETCEGTCLPCDVPALCRNAFFTGKLLTERDFTLEQSYFIDKARLHNLALHGWGIACGLTLTPHPYCPQLRIYIEPGLAVDGCGREIWVRQRIEWELPKVDTKPPPEKDPCPPEPPAAQQPRYEQEPPGAKYYPEGPEPCPSTDLYLSLCYRECETELVPAPFDECACNGITKRASRICEGWCIEWSTTRPADWPHEEECGCSHDEEQDCALIYQRIHKPCPVPAKLCCVPLAVIRGYEQGKPVKPDMIDYRDRRDLVSTHLLDLLIRCILQKLPTKSYTRIKEINWTHGASYSCKDFQRMFVGDAGSDVAIEVIFTNAVRADTLSTMSFQAVVVLHPRDSKEGGYLEVAPAKVWASNDRTKFYLKIEPGFAHHCLERGSFDVFILLRCNVLVDDRGLAVDGTLLARKSANDVIVGPPTGDGIPGGTFESWFRVSG